MDRFNVFVISGIIFLIIVIICLTITNLSTNPLEIRYSITMDNNTLEAIKQIKTLRGL